MRPSGYISEIFSSFQGEGPFLGERHIFVRLSGCSLGCEYCDTRYSLERAEFANVEGGKLKNPLSVEKALDLVLAQEIFPGFNQKLSVTGGEPLEQPEFLRALLEGLNGRFKVLLETNGILTAQLLKVRDIIDVISMDLKMPSMTGKGELWERHREFIDAAKGRELIAKMVVSGKTTIKEVETAAGILAHSAPDALLVIQPVIQSPDAPPAEKLLEFYSCAKKLLQNVRVIPQMHKVLGVK